MKKMKSGVVVFLLITTMMFFISTTAISNQAEIAIAKELVIANYQRTENLVDRESSVVAATSDLDMEIKWIRSWDRSCDDCGRSVWGDGIYVYTLGYVRGGYYYNDLALVKWDADGNIIWNRTWGGTHHDEGYSIWGDGTYLYTLGGAASYGVVEGSYDFALLKWDTDGNIIWERTWGGIYCHDEGYSIWGDGTYLYTLGYTGSGSSSYDFALLKWDTDGNIIWERIWGGTYSEIGYSIWGDGTYLYTLGSGSRDFALLKWDTDGNIIWERTWGGICCEIGYSIWGDGTYLYTLGTTDSFGAGSRDFALLKWDTDGNIIWERTWGRTLHDDGYSIWGDGTYLYTLGSTTILGRDDFALLKWDTDGNIIWERRGGIYCDEGYSIWGDGTYFYTLGSTTQISGNDDFALIKWGPDTTIPELSSPVDINYGEGTTGNWISWEATDNNPGTYIVYKDGTAIETDSWYCLIRIYVDGLTVGLYNYTIVVSDTSGNSARDTVMVTVVDSTKPVLSSPANITYEQGETGNNIAWIVADNDPNIYVIYKDSIEIASDTWSSDVAISINIDGLTPCTYNYTIVVTDEYGNSVQDTVFVTVQDTTNPIFISPADISYEQGDIGYNIIWIATDFNPATYKVYKDSIEIASGVWSSGIPITINVDGLLPGSSYDYTIVVTDMYGNSASDTVIVTVTEDGTTTPTTNNLVAILIASIASFAILVAATVIVVLKKRKHKSN